MTTPDAGTTTPDQTTTDPNKTDAAGGNHEKTPTTPSENPSGGAGDSGSAGGTGGAGDRWLHLDEAAGGSRRTVVNRRCSGAGGEWFQPEVQVEPEAAVQPEAQVELPVVPPEAKQPSRFFFAVLSGVVFFAAYASVTIGNKTIDALIYSVTYNGSYLAVEEIITIIVISIPPVKKALDYVKQMANSR